jgi:hypothetical protein
MSTRSQRETRKRIRDYINRTYIGKISSASEIKEDIFSRFNISNSQWSNIATEVRKNIRAHANGTLATIADDQPAQPEPQPTEIIVPGNLSEDAKVAFARLMNENLRLSGENQSLAAQVAHAQMESVQSSKRTKTLKSLVEQLLDTF